MYSIANSLIAKYTCMDFYMKNDSVVKVNRVKSELVTVGNINNSVTDVTISSVHL